MPRAETAERRGKKETRRDADLRHCLGGRLSFLRLRHRGGSGGGHVSPTEAAAGALCRWGRPSDQTFTNYRLGRHPMRGCYLSFARWSGAMQFFLWGPHGNEHM